MSGFGRTAESGQIGPPSRLTQAAIWTHSRNGTLWNVPLLKQSHCGLMPANLTTLPHFSVSSAISLPKSAGDPPNGVLPSSMSRDLHEIQADVRLSYLIRSGPGLVVWL